jgi:RNA polymerase sigma-70 factor (ECF subfamily)
MSEKRAGKEPGFDSQLVRQVLSGDTQAYGRLVRLHSRRAYAIAYSVVCDFQTAQDIAQEAFVKAYSKLDKLRSPEKFGTWVDTITRNLSRKALARRRRAQLSLTDFSDTSTHPVAKDKPRLTELEEALNSLPEMYREPLVMRYMGGSDYEEIARQLGTTRNAAEVRVHRAKKMLRETLIESGRC